MSLREPTINSPGELQETGVAIAQVVPVPSKMLRARDGSGSCGGAMRIRLGHHQSFLREWQPPSTVAVSPVRPGHAVTVESRVNGALSAKPSGCPSRACTI